MNMNPMTNQGIDTDHAYDLVLSQFEGLSRAFKASRRALDEQERRQIDMLSTHLLNSSTENTTQLINKAMREAGIVY